MSGVKGFDGFRLWMCAALAPTVLPAAAQVAWEGRYLAGQEERLLAPPPAFVGGFAFDGAGVPVVYDGEVVLRHGPEGWKELFREETAVYGAFVVAGDDGALYLGESSDGTIRALDPDTGSVTLLEEIAGNFDMARSPAGQWFVSAPSPNATMEAPLNGVFLVDLDPATPPELVLELPGYSGPMAFNAAGDLYAAPSAWPAPVDVLRVRADDLAGGGVLTASDAQRFAAGLDGAYSLAFGPFGALLVGDSVMGRVLALDGDGTVFTWAAPGSGAYASVTCLDVDARTGRVGFVASDFATFNALYLVGTDVTFQRGMVNDDGEIDLGDAIAILSHLFAGGRLPLNRNGADVNGDGVIDLADAVYLLAYLFAGGPEPPAPFREPGA